MNARQQREKAEADEAARKKQLQDKLDADQAAKVKFDKDAKAKEREDAENRELLLATESEESSDEPTEDELAERQLAADEQTRLADLEAERVANEKAERAGELQYQPSADTVTVTVPKDFSLRHSHSDVDHYKAGVQEMPKAHAEHWYAKAHGVEKYSKHKK